MRATMRRTLVVGVSLALAGGGALVAASPASAADIGGQTINNGSAFDLDASFTGMTDGPCPASSTNFLVKVEGAGVPAGAGNLVGNTEGTAVGGINAGPFSWPASNTLRTWAQLNGVPGGNLPNGSYTFRTVCTDIFGSGSEGDFTGDVTVSGSTVTPVVNATATTTTLVAAPANPLAPGSSATLTATVAPAAAGSVQYFEGAASLGSAPVSSGVAELTGVVLGSGSHTINAVFTSSDPAYAGSTSNDVSVVWEAAPAQDTETLIGGPTTGTVGNAVSIHVDVNSLSTSNPVPASAGSVQLADDTFAPIGSSKPLTAGGATFSFTATAPGTNVICAKFTPANPADFIASQTAQCLTVVFSDAAYQPDPQTVVVTVPAGDLVISTPYTPDNPFDLGTAVLSTDGTTLTASNTFGSAAYPEAGVTITDTRPGSTGWTASAATSAFDNGSGGTISEDHLSFTGVTPQYITGNALQAPMVGVADIVQFTAGPQSFATASVGPGSVHVVGVLGLNAPTSTPAGLYTATVTFTIV